MAAADGDTILRLCVVQLDGIPRAFSQHHSLWIPAKPLVDPYGLSKTNKNVEEVSVRKLFASSDRQAYQRIQDCSTEAIANHLKKVLIFLARQRVDVVVFPEYLIPISCLDDLIKFSLARAVVAGLEQIRNMDQATELAKASNIALSPQDLLQRNVSVLVTDGRVHIVTKRFPATHETALPGAGPLVKEVRLRGRQVKIAVAVCLDYLRSGEEIRHAEIVCIPAYSRSLPPFEPDAPRDNVKLLSNCAGYGGSQIIMSGLRDPLTGPLGVQPISKGYEAVVIAEFDRFLQWPTPLRRSENRLVVRAEIIERNATNQAVLTAIRNVLGSRGPSDLVARSEALTGLLDQLGQKGPLAEALAAYRDLLAQDSDDPRLL